MQLNPPDETRREFLVSLIKQIEDVFPFNYIQRFLYQIFPVVDPSAKPTGSPLGDFVQYSMGWFEANPHLQEHAKLFAQMQLPWNQQNISGIPTHEGEQIYAAPVPFEEYQRLMRQPVLNIEHDPHDTGERQRG